jgi:hypothetical protein
MIWASWLASLADIDWAAVLYRYARGFSWTPLQSATEITLAQAHAIFGPDRNEDGVAQPRAQSGGEQREILNRVRKRRGLPPLPEPEKKAPKPR